MRTNKLTIIVALLAMALVVLSGCGPRAYGGTVGIDDADFAIDLPAIVLDLDSEGQMSVGGMSMGELSALAGGMDMSAFSLEPDMVQMMMDANIQHLQVENTPSGIMILVNGEPIPSLAWDGDALITTAETLDMLGAGVAMLDNVLPLVQNIGLGAVIRIPVPDGVELIPQVVTGDETAAAISRAAQASFLADIGEPPQFHIDVNYDSEGNWELAGLSADDLSAMGVPTEVLNLPPEMLNELSGSGVDSIGLSTNQQGIFIVINDKVLPHISWANGEILHVLNLAASTGMLDDAMAGMSMDEIMSMIEGILPAIQTTEVSLTLNMP
ncbi:MAG: hypothetical protein AAF639_10180 [Chloroflexota bacterium]